MFIAHRDMPCIYGYTPNDVVQFLRHNNTAIRQYGNTDYVSIASVTRTDISHLKQFRSSPPLQAADPITASLVRAGPSQISSSLSSPFRGCAVRPGFLGRRETGVPPPHQRGGTVKPSPPLPSGMFPKAPPTHPALAGSSL